MSRKDQRIRIMAQLDGLFRADDIAEADALRWKELKRHISRMVDALILIFVLLGCLSATAADVTCGMFYNDGPDHFASARWPSGARPTPASCAIGKIYGEIARGDYEKVVAFYRNHHPFLYEFSLISDGGDVDDALKIGRLFRKYLLSASAPKRRGNEAAYLTLPDGKGDNECRASWVLDSRSGCVCASACALIWFGAPVRTGIVGLHRPRIDDPNFRQLPAGEAQSAYRETLQKIGQYLEEMEVPKAKIGEMESRGTADLTWINSDDPEGVDVERSPSFEGWADTTCGSFPSREYKLLAWKLRIRTLHRQEVGRLQQLMLMYGDRYLCESELMSSNREKLPLP